MLLKQGQMYMTDSQVILFFSKNYKKYVCVLKSSTVYLSSIYTLNMDGFHYQRKVGLSFLCLLKADIAISGAP